jgi:hypothetical protein
MKINFFFFSKIIFSQYPSSTNRNILLEKRNKYFLKKLNIYINKFRIIIQYF